MHREASVSPLRVPPSWLGDFHLEIWFDVRHRVPDESRHPLDELSGNRVIMDAKT